jgi:hypothetical protein
LWEFPIEDGLVVVRPDLDGFFLLNQTARLVWYRFRQGLPLAEIASGLAGLFGIPPDLALRDVQAVVASWRQALLAPGPPPGVALPQTALDPAGARPVECLVNGNPLRVLLEPGGVWDEIALRLQTVAHPAPLPLHTFAVGTVADRVLVFRDGVCIGNEENAAGARALLLQSMAVLAGPAAILHAGGCGGVLLAGRSHSGKSTLCAALMCRGLPYHCDDSAVLLPDFHVAPMPFPLALRPGSWPLIESRAEARAPAFHRAPVYLRWGTEVRFLDPLPAPGPAPVKALVFVRHYPSAQTQLAELTVLNTLLALQESGFWVEHTQESIARFLAWLTGLPRYTLQYSDLSEAEDLIANLSTS